MTAGTIPTKAGGAMPPVSVKVWDPFVRLFHWSLATLFVCAYLTGEDYDWLHRAAGYSIAVLVVLRVIWGFVGPRHARFADFVRRPREVVLFLRDSLKLKAPRVLGHNPAGGMMVIALLVMLSLVCVTGMLLTTQTYWGSATVKGLHELAVYTTMGFVLLHLAGVALASIEHGENLVKAMVTGRKESRASANQV